MWRGLISCERCIRSEENNLGWYLKNATEEFLIRTKTAGVIETEKLSAKMTQGGAGLMQG